MPAPLKLFVNALKAIKSFCSAEPDVAPRADERLWMSCMESRYALDANQGWRGPGGSGLGPSGHMGTASPAAGPTDMAPAAGRELAVLDPSVSGWESLRVDLAASGRNVLVLDPNRDGIAQVTEALAADPG